MLFMIFCLCWSHHWLYILWWMILVTLSQTGFWYLSEISQPELKKVAYNSVHGVLKMRWRCLTKTIMFHPEKAYRAIVVCAAHHNFALKQKMPFLKESNDPDQFDANFNTEYMILKPSLHTGLIKCRPTQKSDSKFVWCTTIKDFPGQRQIICLWFNNRIKLFFYLYMCVFKAMFMKL